MKNRLEPGFGATIMIINGGIECGHGSEKPQALHRQAYYRKFAEYFKVMRHSVMEMCVLLTYEQCSFVMKNNANYSVCFKICSCFPLVSRASIFGTTEP